VGAARTVLGGCRAGTHLDCDDGGDDVHDEATDGDGNSAPGARRALTISCTIVGANTDVCRCEYRFLSVRLSILASAITGSCRCDRGLLSVRTRRQYAIDSTAFRSSSRRNRALRLRAPRIPPNFRRAERARGVLYTEPANHYTQLIVWKLAEEIRVHVFGLTAKPRFAEDRRAKRARPKTQPIRYVETSRRDSAVRLTQNLRSSSRSLAGLSTNCRTSCMEHS
jgi:hypothetical protein